MENLWFSSLTEVQSNHLQNNKEHIFKDIQASGTFICVPAILSFVQNQNSEQFKIEDVT